MPILAGQTVPETSFTLRGTVRRAIRVSSEKISFYGKLLRQGGPFPPGLVTAAPTVPLDSLVAECPPSYASTKVRRSTNSPNTFDIEVRPKSSLPAGPFRFEVILKIASRNTRYPDLRLPVEGTILPDIQPYPDSLLLGERALGETAIETVTLASSCGTPFEIISIRPESADTSVEPMDTPEIGGATFRVAQRISKPGRQVSAVRFLLNREDGTAATVTVKVIYLARRLTENRQ